MAAETMGGAVVTAGTTDDRFMDDEEDSSSDEDAPPLPDGVDGAPPPPPVDDKPLFELPEGVDEEEAMASIMGFGGFASTHGKRVEDNHTSAARGGVRKVLKREYRQYMHRKGGFNKPLAPQKAITRS